MAITALSPTIGHRNRPFSRRLKYSQNPSSSHSNIFSLSRFRLQNTNSPPPNASSLNSLSTIYADAKYFRLFHIVFCALFLEGCKSCFYPHPLRLCANISMLQQSFESAIPVGFLPAISWFSLLLDRKTQIAPQRSCNRNSHSCRNICGSTISVLLSCPESANPLVRVALEYAFSDMHSQYGQRADFRTELTCISI
jgi:hypothetical protein